MPYIQRGGGLFYSIGDVARRFIMPNLSRATKLAEQIGEKAIKSKAAKNVVESAKSAVTDGLAHAASQVIEGNAPGKAVQQAANKTANTISNTLKKEAKKMGRNLSKRPKPTTNDNIPLKKAKLTPNKPKKQKQKPKQSVKQASKRLI